MRRTITVEQLLALVQAADSLGDERGVNDATDAVMAIMMMRHLEQHTNAFA